MTRLEVLPFSAKERSVRYELNTFIEATMPFAILVERDLNKPNTGNSYKFGVLNPDGKSLGWLFYGEIVAMSRVEAIKMYQQILVMCNQQDLGQPFAYKVRRK